MEITRNTSKRFEGIWHLDKSALLELDTVIDYCVERFKLETAREERNQVERLLRRRLTSLENISKEPITSVRKQELRTEAKQIARDRRPTLRRKANIIFLSKKEVASETFGDLLKLPDLSHEFPASATYAVSFGQWNIEVSISQFLYRNSINIRTTPSNAEVSWEAFAKLEEWVEGFKLPAWQQVWFHLGKVQVFVILCLLIATAIVMRPISAPPLRTHARELLKDGLQLEEHGKALDIMLRVIADVPVEGEVHTGKLALGWLLGIVGALMIFSVILMSYPRTTIGIGMGVKSIRYQVLWASSVRFIVVTVVLLGILIPTFLSYMHRLFEWQ